MLHPTNETKYRESISADGRPYNTVTGTITFTDGTTMDITDETIPSNAVSISRQCVDDNALMFGGVFTNVLKISVYPDENHQDRYLFFGAKIELTFKIEIEQEEQGEPVYSLEPVPLGIFYVTDAEKPSDVVNLTAYDSMTLLDVPLGSLQFSGSPWAIFSAVSAMTGYPLDFTETDLENFPNYNKDISASTNDGIQTCRDIVKEICQELGCFALDNREGKLKLKKFSKTPDLTLDTGDWYSMTPADYKCTYIGVSITSRSGTYTKMDEAHPNRVGLVWTYSDAPAWDYGTESTQEERTSAIYDLVVGTDEVDGIEYTPANIEMPSDATFECGDMLKLIPRNGDPDDENTWIYTIITSIEWNFHSGMTIESVGINPRIEGSSAAATDTNRLVEQAVERSKIQFLTFTNSSALSVDSTTPVQLGECRFRPTAISDSLFVGTVLLTVSNVADISDTSTNTETVEVPVYAYDDQSEVLQLVDKDGNLVDHLTATGTNTFTYTYERDGKCEVTIYYKLDDSVLPVGDDPYLAKASLENGKHIITLSYPLNNLEMGHNYHFEIYITVSGGTLTIADNSIRGTLFGQEIDDISKFDGLIDVNEDPTGKFTLGKITPILVTHDNIVANVIDDPDDYQDLPNQLAVIKALQIPDPDDPELPIILENISLYNIGYIGVTTIYEGTGEYAPQIYFETVPITDEDGTRFCTEDEIDFFTDDGQVQSGE